MTAANFDTWWSFFERSDIDGQPLHRTPGDAGGDTEWGWTFASWQGYVAVHGGSVAAYWTMGKADFYAPTRLAFWNRVQGDQLPNGVDALWCDFQVGSGGATPVLQHVLGVTADGIVGPRTVAAAVKAAAADASGLINRMTAARKQYYSTLPLAGLFLKGWDRRADLSAVLAQSLVAGKPIV